MLSSVNLPGLEELPRSEEPEPWLAFCIFSGWCGGEVRVAGGMFDVLGSPCYHGMQPLC